MKTLRIIFLIVISLFVLSACASGPFFDDFSNEDLTWALLEGDQDAAIYYNDGTLRIDIMVPEMMAWSFIGANYTDVILEVDAKSVGYAEFDEFGLICRHENEDDFYAGLIGTDGYYAIYKGDFEMGYGYIEVEEDSYGISDAIKGYKHNNEIKMECIGNRISLYANGVELLTVEDETFSSGDVGLMGSTWEDPDVYVEFDNFSAEPAGE